jgi:hypothetical protein
MHVKQVWQCMEGNEKIGKAFEILVASRNRTRRLFKMDWRADETQRFTYALASQTCMVKAKDQWEARMAIVLTNQNPALN